MAADEFTEDEPDTFAIDIQELSIIEKEHPDYDECPVCKNKQWYVLQRPGQIIPRMMYGVHKGVPQFQVTDEIVALACTKCGYIKTHLKAVLDGYIRELKHAARSK